MESGFKIILTLVNRCVSRFAKFCRVHSTVRDAIKERNRHKDLQFRVIIRRRRLHLVAGWSRRLVARVGLASGRPISLGHSALIVGASKVYYVWQEPLLSQDYHFAFPRNIEPTF